MTDKQKRHPVQPLQEDSHGVLRFKSNGIVRRLLDDGPFDMNTIALWDVSQDDRIQFAQLIGYSLGGFGDLSYVTDEAYATAQKMHEDCRSELQARLEYYEDLVGALREQLAEPIAALYGMHKDGLSPGD